MQIFAIILKLILACSEGTLRCDVHHGYFPMVSDVLALPFFDRIQCIISTIFSWSVMQANIRAVYRMCYGKCSDKKNDYLMTLGVIFVVTYPLIGYFDNGNYFLIHGILAIIFFVSTALYAQKLSSILWKKRHKFDPSLHSKFNFLWWLGWIMIGVAAIFAIFTILVLEPYRPISEWVLVILLISYFTFASMVNTSYHSIHPLKQE